ncbi:ABC transporter permease [Mycetocola sp. 2940]|uniref:ABC transporter permease n=1 Tax=Mycetocola sp. 2940 TaxID=3156452 RepID=UPI003390CFF0
MILGVVFAVYLFAPMAVTIPASLTSGEFLEVPPDGLSLRWYEEVFDDSKWLDALVTSFQVSGSAAILATVTAFLAVTGLARSRRWGGTLRPLFFLPMVLPIVVLALGLSRVLLMLGMQTSFGAVVLGQALLGLPIAFIAISAGMVGIDPAIHRAAASLGSTWWRTVFTIDLPLLKQSVFGALILSFAYAFDEAVLALFLAPTGQTTLPTLLYQEASFRASPLLASVSGLVILLTCAIAALALVINRALGRRAQ